MAGENEQFTFTGAGDDYGIMATDKIAAQQAASFLNEDPTKITAIAEKKKDQVDPKKQKQQSKKVVEETEDDDKEEEPKGQTQEEILALLSGDDAEPEEDEEEEEAPDDTKKPGAATAKKEAAKTEVKVEEEEEQEDENEFVTISKDLLQLGVFTLDEDEDEETAAMPNTPEEFSQRFQLEKRKGVIEMLDNFLSSKGEEARQFFDTVLVKGVAPKDFLERYTKIESIKNLDLAKPEDQERIVRENLKRQGYPADSIESKIQRMTQYGEIEEEAKLAQGILLKKEEEEGRTLIAQKQQEINIKAQQKAEFVNNISKVLSDKIKSKEFDGIPVDIKVANSVGHFLTAEKYKTDDGKLLTEFDKYILDLSRPENHAEKVKLGLLIQMLKEDPTLSKIQRKAVSTESNKLFQKLKKDSKNSSNSSSKDTKKDTKKEEATSNSWF